MIGIRALIEPREPEHVVHQLAHALRLKRDAVHRLIDLGPAGQRALLVQLGVGAQRCQRRPQLVAGVSEELPGQLLADGLLRDGGLDPGEHPVQCDAQPADLRFRVVATDPVGEIAGRDAVGVGRHDLDGPKAAPQHEDDAGGDEQAGADRADDQDEPEPPDCLIDVTKAGAGDENAASDGHGLQPELNIAAVARRGLGHAPARDRPERVQALGHKGLVALDEHPRRPAPGDVGQVVLVKKCRPESQVRTCQADLAGQPLEAEEERSARQAGHS